MMKELLQLPNLLSLSRIFLTPLIIWLLMQPGNRMSLIALGVLIVGGITDGLDGYFARRRNQITRLGLILDPLADKVMAAVLVIALIFYRDFPIWLAAVIIGRDLLILAASALLIKDKDAVLPSSMVGKYAFASIAVLLASYIIRFQFGEWIMTLTSLILIAGSIIVYAGYFVQYRKTGAVAPREESRAIMIGRLLVVLLFSAYFVYRLYFHLIDYWP